MYAFPMKLQVMRSAELSESSVKRKGAVSYTHLAEKRDFNIEKANQILDDAGYKDSDGDGIREKDGNPLSFEMITASERSLSLIHICTGFIPVLVFSRSSADRFMRLTSILP